MSEIYWFTENLNIYVPVRHYCVMYLEVQTNETANYTKEVLMV